MTIQTSDRANAIVPSVTLAVNARASQLKRQGKDIINLSVGEPDFDTPDFIKKAAIAATEDGFTKYTAADGILDLKHAIIRKLQRDNQLSYQPEGIIVSNGVKQGLYNLCQAVINPGDEVILAAPYWVSYPAMVLLAGGKPVVIKATQEQNFKITPEQLEKAITEKTKVFILNSPSNPSGQAYNAEELRALTKVLLKHPQIVLVTDDIYEYIFWSKSKFTTPLNVCMELKDRTVIFNGVSKAYAMTGWRIGYAAGPESIIKVMKKIQSQSTGNPNSIAQKAATTALLADRSEFQYMYDAFKQRHDLLLEEVNQLKGFNAIPSDGTFYFFPDVNGAISNLGLKNDIELANYLLENAEVATVPGTGFGMPGHLRFSYAVCIEDIKKSVLRINKVFS